MRRIGQSKAVCLLLASLISTSACTVPANMHITNGLDPRHVDDDVRFRTTYYFRTFDYCWDANVKVSQLADEKGDPTFYRKIIPQTDTLYRYRMTGKASALFSRIRFESGVLKANAIDPFGTQVSFSSEADGFVVRSHDEVKNLADAAARTESIRADRIDRVWSLITIYKKIDPAETQLRADTLAKIGTAMEKLATEDGGAAVGAQLSDLLQASKELKAGVADLSGRMARAETSAEKIQADLKSIADKAEVSIKQIQERANINRLGDCPVGENIRKGFQIMGPEGIKTFDQNDRLILAMSSSAQPLIETLQEYSGRIAASRVDVSAQLLAIANENLRAEAARRLIADARATNADPATFLETAITAFAAGEPK